MKKKRKITERLSDFVTGQGFYIVLILCVAIIGISGYYLYTTLTNDADELTVSGGADITEDGDNVFVSEPEDAEEDLIGESDADALKEDTTKAATEEEDKDETTSAETGAEEAAADSSAGATTVPSTAATVFSWPVNGELIADYSVEVLAYDVTMGDWRTHAGIDILAEIGTKVTAAADGTVTASYEDDLMGTTLIIDHGGGLESMYCNLAEVPTVTIGDEVTTGEVIGAVGNTAIAEAAKSPHLHFEMTLNGVSVNPQDYLP